MKDSATFESRKKPRDISELDSLIFGYEGEENIRDDSPQEAVEEEKPKRKKWGNKKQSEPQVDASASDEDPQGSGRLSF